MDQAHAAFGYVFNELRHSFGGETDKRIDNAVRRQRTILEWALQQDKYAQDHAQIRDMLKLLSTDKTYIAEIVRYTDQYKENNGAQLMGSTREMGNSVAAEVSLWKPTDGESTFPRGNPPRPSYSLARDRVMQHEFDHVIHQGQEHYSGVVQSSEAWGGGYGQGIGRFGQIQLDYIRSNGMGSLFPGR